mgnify:CR=1 FL=1
MNIKAKKEIPKYLRAKELTQLATEHERVKFMLEHFNGIKVIVFDKEGNGYDLDYLPNFPFCVGAEIKILLQDASDQYQELINQIKNLK